MSPHARETRPFASEIKFVIPAALGERIRDWARVNLEPDPYGAGPFDDQYHTASLYFDTTAGDVFHRRGSFGGASIGCADMARRRSVFRAGKARKPGILVKTPNGSSRAGLIDRRRKLTDPEWPGEWFHRRLLGPPNQAGGGTRSNRVARFARTAEGPARLTLDQDLRAASAGGPQFRDRRAGRASGTDDSRARTAAPPAIFKRLVRNSRLGRNRLQATSGMG
jgi:hypothetical protein